MKQKAQAYITIAIIAVVAIIIIASSSFYVVDIKSQCVITQFGKPKKVVKNPGLKIKTPFIQKVKYFEKRIIEWDGEPSDILTRDKENIGINTWARWKIVEPLKILYLIGNGKQGAGCAG